MPESNEPIHVHVPTPGDHYSPATGSAIVTIVYEMSRVHARRGGRTLVLGSRGARHDYPVGECVEVDATLPPPRWQRAADAGFGRLGLGRPFGARAYRPAAAAVPRGFDGVIFVHNNPVAMPMFRRRHPAARVCLWANNELFGSYTGRETRRVVSAADAVICCSHFIARDVIARVGPPLAGKVRVVHNGVDTNRFRPDPARRADGDPVVLFVGRVTPVKGPDLLLRAAAAIRSRVGRFRVRIVGSSNFNAADPLTAYERHLRELARPLGDAVEFQPFVDRARVLDEYQAASVFCAPSNWDEPVSLTVPEAMACGLPTVASRRGGIPEVGGDAVLYFDPPDVGKLADLLCLLLTDPGERAARGRAARTRACVLDWDVLYNGLVAALPPPCVGE